MALVNGPQRPHPEAEGAGEPVRSLRFSHSAVVGPWRQREREMRRLGADVTLATARRWNEGGETVSFDAEDDGFASPVRTWGSHPSLFVFDPRPVWKMLRGSSWDVLDVHEEPVSLAVAEMLVLRSLNRLLRRKAETERVELPFLLYSAQNIDKRYPPPFRWAERFALHRAAAAYVCNEAAGRILVSKGMRGTVEVIPLGVDLETFYPAERETPSKPLKVGYVGRLEEKKGVDVLLRAAALEKEMLVEIVGAGPDSERLEALCDRLAVRERVTFRGFATQRELPDIYRRFDVLVVPSIPWPGWLEQFCRVAVEAMASGVPVVASDTGALPEVVGDGGIVVTPGDPQALIQVLRRIAEEPDLWSDLRERAIRRSARFAWPVVAKRHLELYRTVSRGSSR